LLSALKENAMVDSSPTKHIAKLMREKHLATYHLIKLIIRETKFPPLPQLVCSTKQAPPRSTNRTKACSIPSQTYIAMVACSEARKDTTRQTTKKHK
jgi:hypothetical protein